VTRTGDAPGGASVRGAGSGTLQIDAALLSGDAAEAAEQAAQREAEGYAAVWSFEGPHDPFLPLALASQRTERVLLGTAIAVAFARNPMLCAQIAQDLQRLARGRFVLGLGTQIKPHVERRFSQPWSRPVARMREFVAAIRAIWRCWNGEGRLDFRGEFYTHTLMTPMFSPKPGPWGDPPIYLAGVGEKMVEMVGEVADGFLVHPFHSKSYLEAVTLPALERGLAAAGRARGDLAVSCQTIVALGANDEQVERARHKARGQISFYGSTPAYRGLLDHHGQEGLQEALHRMSRQGQWGEMTGAISDDLFDAIAVSGTPAEVAEQLRARNSFADRTTLVLYNEASPEAPVELVRKLAAG
jgi:probable F420-dependent oxidoreductase